MPFYFYVAFLFKIVSSRHFFHELNLHRSNHNIILSPVSESCHFYHIPRSWNSPLLRRTKVNCRNLPLFLHSPHITKLLPQSSVIIVCSEMKPPMICLDPLDGAIGKLACGHRLHSVCIEQLGTNGFSRCPICRRNSSTGSPIKPGQRSAPVCVEPYQKD